MKRIPTRKRTIRISKVVRYLISAVVWIIIWQICAMCISSELFLPTPWEVCRTLFTQLIISGSFWLSISFSLLHIGAGFLAGCILGIALAVVSALWEPVETLLWFPMKVIQSVPVASFVILILLWVPSEFLSVIIPFMIVMPMLYTHTLTGIKQTNRKLLEMAQVFEVSFFREVRYIYIPSLLPHVLSAATLAIGMAWKSGVAAEIIGLVRNSIGNQLYQAKIHLLTPELFAWTLVITWLSIACEQLVRYITHKLLNVKRGDDI